MIKADLHIHTKYSLDSSIDPKLLVEQLYAHPSIKVIAVTDHNTFDGYYKAKQLASAYTDILVIPGIEIRTPIGDLIILGVDEKPRKMWDMQEAIGSAKSQDGLIIVPHPYREYGLGGSAKRYAVDAIETINGTAPAYVNKLAESLAKEMNLPGVAGSDAHHTEELWTVENEIEASMDVNDVLKAIKRGMVKASSIQKSIRF